MKLSKETQRLTEDGFQGTGVMKTGRFTGFTGNKTDERN